MVLGVTGPVGGVLKLEMYLTNGTRLELIKCSWICGAKSMDCRSFSFYDHKIKGIQTPFTCLTVTQFQVIFSQALAYTTQ